MLKTVSDQAKSLKNRLAELETKCTLEPNREKERWNQMASSSEAGYSVDLSADEYNPADWVVPTAAQILLVDEQRLKIKQLFEATVKECCMDISPNWVCCPVCGKEPVAKPIGLRVRNSCVRCDRFEKREHALDAVYCQYHGLELKLVEK